MGARAASKRWSEERANAWAEEQGWIVGANFVPSTAQNQIEMWQASTFDPVTINWELGYAKDIGMNSMRVFLHYLVWQEYPEGGTRLAGRNAERRILRHPLGRPPDRYSCRHQRGGRGPQRAAAPLAAKPLSKKWC